jgi:peptide/nickel transport system permease protein
MREGSVQDHSILIAANFLSSLPEFATGVFLACIFAVWLGWFPSAGYVPIERGGFEAWLLHITLPAIALSFDTIADVARQLRSGLIGVIDSPSSAPRSSKA